MKYARIIGMLILLACLNPALAHEQDCPPTVEEATDPHLRGEIAARGWDRWGCFTNVEIHAGWTAPTTGGPVAFYELAIRGRGITLGMEVEYKYIPGTEYIFWWPSMADTLTGNVRAWGFEGIPGEWSDPSDIYVIGD